MFSFFIKYKKQEISHTLHLNKQNTWLYSINVDKSLISNNTSFTHFIFWVPMIRIISSDDTTDFYKTLTGTISHFISEFQLYM